MTKARYAVKAGVANAVVGSGQQAIGSAIDGIKDKLSDENDVRRSLPPTGCDVAARENPDALADHINGRSADVTAYDFWCVV